MFTIWGGGVLVLRSRDYLEAGLSNNKALQVCLMAHGSSKFTTKPKYGSVWWRISLKIVVDGQLMTHELQFPPLVCLKNLKFPMD